MPKGIYKRTDEMREKIRAGVKAHLPSTAFPKGVNSFPETKFQKGYTPYNKGTVGIHKGAPKGQIPWNKKGGDSHASSDQSNGTDKNNQ